MCARATTYELPYEIIQLILNFLTDPFNLQDILNIRLLNREKAAQLHLVPLMHHEDKTIRTQALLDACISGVFNNSRWHSFLYYTAYAMCTAKGTLNCSAELYDAVVKLFESESVTRKCSSGEMSARQIKKIISIVNYLERFYVKRMRVVPLENLASELISKCVT